MVDRLDGSRVEISGDATQQHKVMIPARFTIEAGRRIPAGEVIGHVLSGSQSTPVVSPFTGATGAVLAWSGERLSAHQPVMWLSVDDGRP